MGGLNMSSPHHQSRDRDRMQAVVCTRYGPPEVLELREIDKPVPAENEILIKVHATSVTAADFRVRSFTFPRSCGGPCAWRWVRDNLAGPC
jgi:hypothetical protein